MIAVAYLAVVVFFGDALAHRWFRAVTWPHRLATAFLVGLVVATWLSYLAGLALDGRGNGMVLGTIVAGWAMGLVGIWLWRRAPPGPAPARPDRAIGWDGPVLVAIVVLVAWMMLSTYSLTNGELRIALPLWSDFGPTTAIAQMFALGDGFPTEYPHYAGEPIRYHFLYYFAVGQLTFLGLDPAAANGILSIASMVSLLVVVMALGERLFGSAAVGRLAAAFFFAHGALSVIPYLAGLGSVEAAVAAIPSLDRYLSSGFPWRGEEWGVWTQNVFLNQRHLPSAIGLLLVIVVFLLDRLPRAEPGAGWRELRGSAARTVRRPLDLVREAATDPYLPGYVLCGLLAGLLPLWNGAMFVAAAAVLAVWFVVFPRRPSMLVIAVLAGVVALPQLLWVRPGTMAGEQTYPGFLWGYTIEDPSPVNVATYLGFVFGPKLLLAAVALALGTWRQARVLLAFTSLVAVAFLLQLSVEVLANHKFLNAWLVVLNVSAAYGVVRLWRARPVVRVPARMVAASLLAVIVVGGVIDLVPVHNHPRLGVALDGDPLYEWVRDETAPDAVFLTDIHVVHPILLAGRRLHFGWTYYAWSAGYGVHEREAWYRDAFAERGARELATRLSAAGIDYVAFDDSLRERGFAPRLNEEVFRAHFEPAFTAEEGAHGDLVVYRVPHDPGVIAALPEASGPDMYAGGAGAEPGRFADPRGIAVDRAGTVYVADTGNDRVQHFSSSGNLLDVITGAGDGNPGLIAPVGVAVAPDGRLFIACRDGRLHEYDADGRHQREWTLPEASFGSPADVVAGANATWVLDTAGGRVVRVDGDGAVVVLGGDGDGLLREPSGLAVVGDTAWVADAGNARVVALGADGTVLHQWPVAEWADLGGHPVDIATDGTTVWLSDPVGGTILVRGADGTPVGALDPSGPVELAGPAGLALTHGGALVVLDAAASRVSLIVHPRP